jgi:hypothetical protein
MKTGLINSAIYYVVALLLTILSTLLKDDTYLLLIAATVLFGALSLIANVSYLFTSKNKKRHLGACIVHMIVMALASAIIYTM